LSATDLQAETPAEPSELEAENLADVPSRGAFERMMRGTKRRAYSMALHLTRNATEAEDLVQETYIKAWRGFHGYASDRPFLNWLLRIMQRAYLDARRRENPIRKADSLHAIMPADGADSHELLVADTSRRPDQEAFRAEYVREVRSALGDLQQPYREAIELCDIEGLSYFEIAKVQGTTVGTVRSRIHRGRKILREIVMRKSPLLRPQ
jgi:RNA polymerase sigma-70 factor (ECF subfamily)